MFGRRKVAALVAEFLGTGALTLLILTVQRSQLGLPFFVAIASGLIFALMSFALGGASGGYFNPAVTLALWTARKISTLTGVLYIVAQMVGGYAAYGLYTYYVNTHFQSIGGKYSTHILIAEAVGTAIFSFGLAATVYNVSTRAASAAYAGLAYMIGVLAASSAALGLLNPAVALGAKAWVWGTYVLGPILGALVGVNLYALLFAEPEVAVTAAPAVAATPAKTSSKPVRKAAKKPATRKK